MEILIYFLLFILGVVWVGIIGLGVAGCISSSRNLYILNRMEADVRRNALEKMAKPKPKAKAKPKAKVRKKGG